MDKTLQKFDNNVFSEKLIEWYEQNKRDLPWRKSQDPYRIWVSEIMLQQTKVDTVITYYENFMRLYPTFFELAKANEQDVLKIWEGLGYYSRARNLHHAAKEVVEKYNGEVPKTASKLGDLKGIGPYTKGAILSIAFDQPEPAVDGNVMRVLSRVLYIKDNISEQRTRKRFEEIVGELIKDTKPSSFNQALMELGALICSPKKPACLLCPVKEVCRALEVGEAEQLPVKLKKKKQRIESFIVLLLQDKKGRIAIEKRPDKGLLANMWQFPMIDKQLFEEGLLEQAMWNRYHIRVKMHEKSGNVKHIFSHIIWKLDVYHAKCQDIEVSNLEFVEEDNLNLYPFSVSHLKVMDMLW